MSKGPEISSAEDLGESATISADAYTSVEYARAERDKLWRKVWQQVGRIEEIPEVGNYLAYEIHDDSIIIVRTAVDSIKAYHNVCPHRGRRLVDIPEGAKQGCGRKTAFTCGFHGWRFNLEGENTHIPHKDDWCGTLTPENTRLGEVKVDTWGGWVWINMDPKSESLQEYLDPAAGLLDPFELQNMRYRWRKWGIFDCNWKVAMEAFNETYHVATTHPEFNKYGEFRGWARAQGKHSNIGYEAPKSMDQNQAGKLRVGTGADPRLSTAEMQMYTWTKANTNTTQTMVDAAQRLKDELPEGTPAGEVLMHWLKTARADDAARGVVWPVVDPAHVGKSGTAWQIFPNFQIGHAVNNALCYSARPYGDDPNKCIFEAAVYELFPKGQEPKTEWTFSPATEEAWCYVLGQDFSNMAAVQKGMKSAGFKGTKPNPYMERSTVNLHFNLAKYMGTGAPRKLK
ncbi:aromatic ring-hydroxylating oxygenase subunit alpha [Stenotrophobium rhamnosiphilum]|uniref:(2Fe-2S)-binding protein n=1 Tax=Stenotrophobium rhamnosiphilum TaxID=2029166 RepID=A0A2T5MD27_9GAMM|nr:aromatic ring-hydroxylating dioxygenase subunit alpha [Stenotrophobium rhamnosiphilum]PTU30475.1 (2Fe-2S)-binding protein [Stenotrophobium rhamnosiphilum]